MRTPRVRTPFSPFRSNVRVMTNEVAQVIADIVFDVSEVSWVRSFSDKTTPSMICAFSGWTDAGDSATAALRFLRDKWDSQLVATIPAEEFFNFTQLRPTIRCGEGLARVITWPDTEIWECVTPDGSSVVLVIGVEPHLRWRTFANAICEVVEQLPTAGSRTPRLLTVGALLAEVAHTRDAFVFATSQDPQLMAEFDVESSTYEGPTGVLAAIHDASAARGIPSASLWATVPAYVPSVECPKATYALLERIGDITGHSIEAIELERRAVEYEDQVNELVSGDAETEDYVRRLELDGELIDSSRTASVAFISEVEQFLREQ